MTTPAQPWRKTNRGYLNSMALKAHLAEKVRHRVRLQKKLVRDKRAVAA